MTADLKVVRVKNRNVYAEFHAQGHRCLCCGSPSVQACHLLRGNMREDVLEALVPLCYLAHPAFDSSVRVHGGNVTVLPTYVRQKVAEFLRSDAGADHAAYLISRLGPFGAEDYVQKLEAA